MSLIHSQFSQNNTALAQTNAAIRNLETQLSQVAGINLLDHKALYQVIQKSLEHQEKNM